MVREPSPARGRWGARWLGMLALFAVSLLAVSALRQRDREDVLGSDEPEWLAISVLHVRQLVDGGPAPGAERGEAGPGANPWMLGVQRTTFGYMNPCLPKLIWGTTLRLSGHGDASALVFQSFHQEDLAAGLRARDALLAGMPLARRVVMVFAALAASLLFLATRRVFAGAPAWQGWACGALAWGLWVASPPVRHTASYLRTDHFMLTFLLATLLWVSSRREQLFGVGALRARLVAAGVAGLLIGCAISSKLNGSLAAMGLVLSAVLCTCGAARGSERPARPWLAGATAVLVAGALAALVFVALQPVTWAGPLEGAREILARWDRHTGFIQNSWAPRTGVEVVRTPLERLSLFGRALFGRHDPLALWTGLPLGIPLALGGLLALLARGRSGFVHAAFYAVLLLGTALSLPIDWERLFLPALVALVSLEAIGLTWLVARLIPANRI